jgi:hypothetical protein
VRRDLAALAGAVAALAPAAAGADPSLDWALHCRGCHGEDGRGAPGSVPDLRGSVGRFLRAPGGREFLVRVPGAAQSELDDARLAALLDWMLRAFSPGEIPPDHAPYTAAEVARWRAEPLADVERTRAELLREVEAGAR